MSDAGRRAASTLAAAILLAAILTLGVRGVASRVPPPSAGGVALVDAGWTFLLFGLLAAVAWLGMRQAGVRPAMGRHAALGAGLGLAGLLTAYALAALAGASARGGAPFLPGLALLGTLAILVQAGAEELYFRGWLLGALERGWGAWPALLASAAAFAGLHLLGGTRAPLSLANLLLAGLLFGLLAQRTGGLAAPIAAHAGWNWAEGLLLGLDPNPGAGSFGAVWDHDLVGTALWGGSAEGLNASLGTGAVLIAMLLPLAAWTGVASRSGWRG